MCKKWQVLIFWNQLQLISRKMKWNHCSVDKFDFPWNWIQYQLLSRNFLPIFYHFAVCKKLRESVFTEFLPKLTQITMLQKLSKCEVKAWLCWNWIISLQLRFYVKSNFGAFKRSKNVIFGNFWDSELWILVNLGLESCSNLLKSKFRTSKIVKINIFGPFVFTKIGFHVKSECL